MNKLDRRRFLKGSLTALGATGIGAAVGGGAGVAQAGDDRQAAATPMQQVEQVNGRSLATRIPFDGTHQSGIITPPADQATFLALDTMAPNRAELTEGLQALTAEARRLTQGDTVGVTEVDDPPPDSGTLGPIDSPDSLTVTIGFGASLFDSRYGLASRRPARLTEMPVFDNDRIDPARAGGDVSSRSAPASATRSCTRCATCCARSPAS